MLKDALAEAPLDRAAGYELMARLQDDWIVTSLFGGTYQREGLSLRDRQIANLAALTALGGVEPQLAQHVRASLRVGMAPQEVVEVLVHLAPYVGVPKALAGLRVAAQVLAEADA
jgi:4-carboxymuconolactone decarboxylase